MYKKIQNDYDKCVKSIFAELNETNTKGKEIISKYFELYKIIQLAKEEGIKSKKLQQKFKDENKELYKDVTDEITEQFFVDSVSEFRFVNKDDANKETFTQNDKQYEIKGNVVNEIVKKKISGRLYKNEKAKKTLSYINHVRRVEYKNIIQEAGTDSSKNMFLGIINDVNDVLVRAMGHCREFKMPEVDKNDKDELMARIVSIDEAMSDEFKNSTKQKEIFEELKYAKRVKVLLGICENYYKESNIQDKIKKVNEKIEKVKLSGADDEKSKKRSEISDLECKLKDLNKKIQWVDSIKTELNNPEISYRKKVEKTQEKLKKTKKSKLFKHPDSNFKRFFKNLWRTAFGLTSLFGKQPFWKKSAGEKMTEEIGKTVSPSLKR